ncbi:unnamed protein product [Somion occarium]|uniref:Aminoglycoside phosphotransferase domain-containing protein n=1 Tax=Somion occarium TaxID=3059160 RepID=A0ABP1CP52_9APHY
MGDIPFWDADGNMFLCAPPPLFCDEWRRGDEIPVDQRDIHARVEDLLQCPISSIKILAVSVNTTMEIVLQDGRKFILRHLPFITDDYGSNSWRKRKLETERDIMLFLNRAIPQLPVPELHRVEVQADYGEIWMEELPGLPVINCYTLFNVAQKEACVLSYADFALKLFRLQVPDQIGSASLRAATTEDDSLTVVPRISHPERACCPTVLASLEEHVAVSIQKCLSFRSANEDVDTIIQIRETLTKLEVLLSPLMEQLGDKHLRRCVLVHEDLRSTNILADTTSGRITGVLDWEYHAFLPAVLAASYPEWLLYTGPCDCRFRDPDPTVPGCVWFDSPENAKHYMDLFDQERDPEYFDCLKRGEHLRDALQWLPHRRFDRGCKGLRAWMECTF